MPVKFIHITDTHQVAPGAELAGLDPRARLDACIADVNAHHADAELCVLTGDLVDDGGAASYGSLRQALNKLVVPWRLMIGNHDHRETFRAAFPETAADDDGFVQSAFDTSAGRFILLDTVEAGQPWGSFCARRARWLDRELDRAGDAPVYLFMHHPPFDIGLPSMDRIRLLDAAALGAVLEGQRNVRHIFMGHVHRAVSGSWRGIPFSIVPATNHQVCFDLSIVEPVPKNRANPAYGVVFIDGEGVVVHVHDYLDRSDLPLSRPARHVA